MGALGKIKNGLAPAYDTGPLAGMPIQGMTSIGNIDVNHRPSITNADGTHSTIFSMTAPIGANGGLWPGSYANAPGYALVPSIANGKFLTPNGAKPDERNKRQMSKLEDAADDYYANTGENLGKFSSGSAADSYAGATHAYMNDGTARKVFAPSPPVVGSSGINGYPAVPPLPSPSVAPSSMADLIKSIFK